MKNKSAQKTKSTQLSTQLLMLFGFLFIIVIIFFFFPQFFSGSTTYSQTQKIVGDTQTKDPAVIQPQQKILLPLDKVAYDAKMLLLANNPPDPIVYNTIKTVTKDAKGKSITTTTKVPLDPQPVRTHLWPVKTVYPNAGAILPFNRIIAYYGNLYSTKMGVLGQYPEDEMLARLKVEVDKWTAADPATPAIPALHYIAVVAQGSAGTDGKYRARMPSSEIDKVIAMAAKINGLVFLDIQVGLSNVQTEVPLLQKYLKLPNVHLGLDPEFSMKTGAKPGKVIGTMDATDINFAVNYLDKLATDNNLPPKILVVHRFTQGMVTNVANIKPTSNVQIIMNMDGWGGQAKKIGTYKNFIYPQPVQFTGFKLFYKNDVLTAGTTLMTPETLLKLNPQPIYIQFQ